jgi:hypothetical protein
MDFDIKLEGFDTLQAKLDPNIARQAARSAINKMADRTKNEASRKIREEYNIPAARLNEYLRVTARATDSGLFAIISGQGLGVALYYFSARQSNMAIIGAGAGRFREKFVWHKKGSHAGPVTVQIKKAGGRKEVSSRFGAAKPFIAQMKTGHIGVFERPGKERLPIKPLYGPGVSKLFAAKQIQDLLKKFVNENFPDIFNHELDYYTKK